MRRGWVVISSFFSRHGDDGVNPRFRYVLRRDEMMAVGLAELCEVTHVSACLHRSRDREGAMCAARVCTGVGRRVVLLFNKVDDRSQRNGQFLHGMRTVSGLLQNLCDSRDDLIIDGGIIYFTLRRRRRRRRGVVAALLMRRSYCGGMISFCSFMRRVICLR